MAVGSTRIEAAAEEGMPVFVVAGTPSDGEFHCASCGYGVSVRRMLPTCPMCGGETWEPVASSPFA